MVTRVKTLVTNGKILVTKGKDLGDQSQREDLGDCRKDLGDLREDLCDWREDIGNRREDRDGDQRETWVNLAAITWFKIIQTSLGIFFQGSFFYDSHFAPLEKYSCKTRISKITMPKVIPYFDSLCTFWQY